MEPRESSISWDGLWPKQLATEASAHNWASLTIHWACNTTQIEICSLRIDHCLCEALAFNRAVPKYTRGTLVEQPGGHVWSGRCRVEQECIRTHLYHRYATIVQITLEIVYMLLTRNDV